MIVFCGCCLLFWSTIIHNFPQALLVSKTRIFLQIEQTIEVGGGLKAYCMLVMLWCYDHVLARNFDPFALFLIIYVYKIHCTNLHFGIIIMLKMGVVSPPTDCFRFTLTVRGQYFVISGKARGDHFKRGQ